MLERKSLRVIGAALFVAWAVGSGCAEGTVQQNQGGGIIGIGGNGKGGEGGSSLCAEDCSAIATPECLQSVCNDGSYQGVVGDCVVVPSEVGTACDDELFCTVEDGCDGAGQCAGGPQNDCGMMPSACNEVSCDETAKQCIEVPAMNGAPCQDPQNLCLKGSTCNNGLCIGGTVDDCFFFPVTDDCHEAICNPTTGMCEEQIGNEGDPCVDAMDLCTVGKTCMTGMCVGGGPKDCSMLTVGCFDGVCDTTTGQCIQQPIMPGQQCAQATDDCNIGICDMNGSCNPTPTNENGPCNDFQNCTLGDHCVSGVCTPSSTITQCTNNDMCCPMGCNDMNDNDCTYCDWNPTFFPLQFGGFSSVGDLTFDNNCNLYVVNDASTIYKINHNTNVVQQIMTGGSGLRGITFRPQDGMIYYAAYDTIYKMTTSGSNQQLVIASLSSYLNGMTTAPSGWGSYGGHLVVGSSSGQIYVINPASPAPFVLGTSSTEVSDVEFDKQNNTLYVADHSSFQVLILSPQGTFTTYVTTSCEPDGLAVDDGNRLFYSCGCTNQIYRVNIPTPGTPTVVASPFLNCYWAPAGLIYDGLDNLIVLTEPSGGELEIFTP
jgi:hypothetical protein